MSPEAEKVRLRHAVVQLRIVTWIGAFLIALIVVWGWGELHPQAKPFDPLRYPTPDGRGQIVVSRVPGVKGPAAHAGHFVEVQGTACNLSTKAVGIVGRTFWVVVKPPGTSVLASEADNVRQPGCQNFDFQNPMPAAVADIARDRPDAVWRIAGDVTPAHARGVTRTWHTETFRIVP